MSVSPVQAPPPPVRPVDRVRSFLGYAFLISLLIHVVTVPFFGLKARQQQKQEVEKVSVTKKIKVIVPTPPPPTPTPPPPTPPPKQTPPPVKHTAPPPPQPKLKIDPPKTTSKSNSASSEKQYVVPKTGSQEGVPSGTVASGRPAPVAATGPPAATAAPTAAPTLKPTCAVPNADAATVQAAEPDYPDMARQQGATGTANIKVTLDAAGHVLDASVQKSAGNPALDQSAVKAAKASTFSPEVVNCVKTAGSYLFTAVFNGQ